MSTVKVPSTRAIVVYKERAIVLRRSKRSVNPWKKSLNQPMADCWAVWASRNMPGNNIMYDNVREHIIIYLGVQILCDSPHKSSGVGILGDMGIPCYSYTVSWSNQTSVGFDDLLEHTATTFGCRWNALNNIISYLYALVNGHTHDTVHKKLPFTLAQPDKPPVPQV